MDSRSRNVHDRVGGACQLAPCDPGSQRVGALEVRQNERNTLPPSGVAEHGRRLHVGRPSGPWTVAFDEKGRSQLSQPIRVLGPNGAQTGPLRSERVTKEQARIAFRRRCYVEARHWVRDDIADGILALHDFHDPELARVPKGHGKHHSICHIQPLVLTFLQKRKR
jgi:hypothetical protein